MSRPSYRFRSAWRLARPGDSPLRASEVYDVLEDVENYPTWWRSVLAVGKLENDAALVACRSRLPKTLHLVLRSTVQNRPGGVLRVALDGDLVGWSRFELTAHAGGVDVCYTQEVDVRRRLLGWAGRLARPLLRWNHEQMMLALREDLADLLDVRPTSSPGTVDRGVVSASAR